MFDIMNRPTTYSSLGILKVCHMKSNNNYCICLVRNGSFRYVDTQCKGKWKVEENVIISSKQQLDICFCMYSLCVSVHLVQRPTISWFHRNWKKIFPVGPLAILANLFSLNFDHFRCIVIIAESSVVPDTLIDLLLNLNTLQSCIINHTFPSSESFQPFVTFPLAHIGLVILNCHYFDALRPQYSVHISLLFFGVFFQESSRTKRVTVLSLPKRLWELTLCKLGEGSHSL
jgi:hypothetical protein